MLLMPNSKNLFKNERYKCSKCGKSIKLSKVEYQANNRKCPKCGGILLPYKIDPRMFLA